MLIRASLQLQPPKKTTKNHLRDLQKKYPKKITEIRQAEFLTQIALAKRKSLIS